FGYLESDHLSFPELKGQRPDEIVCGDIEAAGVPDSKRHQAGVFDLLAPEQHVNPRSGVAGRHRNRRIDVHPVGNVLAQSPTAIALPVATTRSVLAGDQGKEGTSF